MLRRSVFSQTANCMACTGCSLPRSTALDDPPQLADARCRGSHCGMGATRHVPAVFGALPFSSASPHCAPTQATIFPSCTALYQPVCTSGMVNTRPRRRSLSQYAATFRVAGPSMSTDQRPLLSRNQRAPACQASAMNHWELAGGNVPMRACGSLRLITAAALA